MCDKPAAPALALVNRALGAKIEFRRVSFVYPSGRDRIAANNDRLRAADSEAEAEASARAPSTPAAALRAARFALVFAFVFARECLCGQRRAVGPVRLHDIESGTSASAHGPKLAAAAHAHAADTVGPGGGRAAAGRGGGSTGRGRGNSGGKDSNDDAASSTAKLQTPIANVLCDISFTIDAGKTAALVRCACRTQQTQTDYRDLS